MIPAVIMTEHRNALVPGYRLRDYTIKHILGQGGFGITYLAYDETRGRQVAIKEYLPMEMAVRETNSSIQPVSGEYGERFKFGLERFIREARVLKLFRHPHIVRALRVFSDNNTAYLVMPYEAGESLHAILKQVKTLEQGALLELLLPLLDGLDHIHATGFIHRDIKPANIIIRRNGEPVLIDFGSAREAIGQHTGNLTSMYSPGYAPFEQYTGKKANQGPWTDIYGLGATLYKCITGRAPADAMHRGEALLQTDRDLYVPLQEINPPGYTEHVLNAIDQALCFRPSQRPIAVNEWRKMFEATTHSTVTPFPRVPSSTIPSLSCLEAEAVTAMP